MVTTDKFKIITFILRLTSVVALAVSLFIQSWLNVVVSLTTVILSYLPVWLEKKYRIDIPIDFEFAIILFVYSSLLLGEVTNFYERFWWWDLLLHFSSALAFACIGFIILIILLQTDKIKSTPIWVGIFSFCFSVSIGVLWEIFEFIMDQIFGLNMQKSGLVDTMSDLVVDCFGAIIAAFAGYAYIKGNRRSYLSRLIGVFFNSNPNFRI